MQMLNNDYLLLPEGNPVRISYYDVAEKFGTTVNELSRIEDFSYSY